MLITIFVLMFSRYLDSVELRLTFQLEEGYSIPIINIIVITVLSAIMKEIMSPGKKLESYREEWKEPEVSIARIIYTGVVASGFTYILYSIEKQNMISRKIVTIWLIVIAVLDIVNVIVIYNYYVLDIAEAIKSAIYVQMRNVINALWIIILFMMVFKFTTYGVLFLFFIIGGIIGWLWKKMT